METSRRLSQLILKRRLVNIGPWKRRSGCMYNQVSNGKPVDFHNTAKQMNDLFGLTDRLDRYVLGPSTSCNGKPQNFLLMSAGTTPVRAWRSLGRPQRARRGKTWRILSTRSST